MCKALSSESELPSTKDLLVSSTRLAGSHDSLQGRHDCLYFVDKETEKEGGEGICSTSQSWDSNPSAMRNMDKYKTRPCA